MKRTLCLLILVVYTCIPLLATAAIIPVAGGYQVSYNVNLTSGTSNGSDIQDTFIFEWNDSGDFAVSSGFTIAGQGNTVLTHVIDFEPTFALVMGWGAASSCSPVLSSITGLVNFVAMRPTTASPAGGCEWAGSIKNTIDMRSFFCTICGPDTNPNCSDDLPVELMEFSVGYADDDPGAGTARRVVSLLPTYGELSWVKSDRPLDWRQVNE